MSSNHSFIGAVALIAAIGFPVAAFACSAPNVQFFDPAPQARIFLLPEDRDALDLSTGITVTGGYTGQDERGDGAPNPVGFFVRAGEAINLNGARMDGVLAVTQAGVASIHVRDEFALTTRAGRVASAQAASQNGQSLLQSHLLIRNGQLDLSDVENAPLFVRRILFTTADGMGVWQSDRAINLYDAGAALRAECAPDMALNLDMGSYDFCALDGQNCGFLGHSDTSKLSNLVHLKPSDPASITSPTQ